MFIELAPAAAAVIVKREFPANIINAMVDPNKLLDFMILTEHDTSDCHLIVVYPRDNGLLRL